MQCPGGNRGSHAIPILTANSNHEMEMDQEAEAKTIRLTSEIVRCTAKTLLASAEELERSLWHYSAPTERPQSSSECGDDALTL
jgi:hypothetical protein